MLSFPQLLSMEKDAGRPEPLIIAAGGGGASDTRTDPTSSDYRSANAKGLVDPWASMAHWKSLIASEDLDAGKVISFLSSKEA